MHLVPLGDDLWATASHLVLPGGVHFPLRATVVRLPSGGLWIHSPVAFDDVVAREIDALGPVEHLVAPNLLHHLHLGTASARWPDATTWGPRGLAAKRPDLRLDHTLDEPHPWADAIAAIAVRGAPSIDETVFFHGATSTLLVTDLMFHIEDAPNLQTRWLFKLVGVWQRLAQSRLWRLTTRDRAAAASDIHRVLAWPVKRVVPCHGAITEIDDPATLTRALAWMASGAPLQLP